MPLWLKKAKSKLEIRIARKVARIDDVEGDAGKAPPAALDHFARIIDADVIGAELEQEGSGPAAADAQVQDPQSGDVAMVSLKDRRFRRL